MGTTILSEDTFRSYADKIKTQLELFLADNSVDRIWNNWEKVNATNVETTSLTPTIKGKMKVDLKGNTQQNGTPTLDTPIPVQVVSGDNTIKVEGKNLFDVNGTYTGNNIGHINIENNNITINDTTGWGGTYCLFDKSYNYGDNYIFSFVQGEVSMNVLYKYYDSNGNSITTGGRGTYNSYYGGFLSELNNFVPYCPNAVSFKIGLVGKASQVSSMSNIQLELNNQATSYTPYTSQTLPISLAMGKNKFNNKVEQGAIGFSLNYTYSQCKTDNATRIRTINLVELDKTKTYTISCETGYELVIQAFNSNQLLYEVQGITNEWVSSMTFTNIPYIAVAIRKSNQANITPSEVLNAKVMLEIGDTATTYEPYNSIELCKIGDYQDYIYKDNGKWYLHKEIGKVVLDGSESGWVKDEDNPGRYNLPTPNAILGSSTNNPVLSDRFQPRFAISNYSIFLSGANHLICIIYQDITWNVETWKTWLSTHNTTVYYVLATPTYEEITGELLSQLEALAYSYDEQTNISQENDDMPFILNITALKNI